MRMKWRTLIPTCLLMLAIPAGWAFAAAVEGASESPDLVPPTAPATSEEPAYTFTAFRLTGDLLIPQENFDDLFEAYVDRPIAISDLQRLVAEVEAEYHLNGYILTVAYLPEQTVTDGVARIAVVPGRYGAVRDENESKLRDGIVRPVLREIVLGDPVYGPTLDEAIAALANLPGVEASSAFRAGETELVVFIEDGTAWSGTVTLDGTVPDLTENLSLNPKVRWSNPLGLGDQATFSITTDGRSTAGGQLTYELPVGRALAYRLISTAGVDRTSLDGEFAGLGGAGSNKFGVALTRSWQSQADAQLDGRLSLEHRHQFNETFGQATSTRYNTFGASMEWSAPGAELTDPLSQRWKVELIVGHLALGTEMQKFIDDLAARTRGTYGVLRAEADVSERLGREGMLAANFSGQWATKNLPSPEKFSIGGRSGVRSYAGPRASGDEGLLTRIEYTHAPVTAGPLPGTLQPIGFVDAGGVTYNKEPWDPTGKGGRVLAGVGVGLRWFPSQPWRFEVQQGWTLTDSAGDVAVGTPGPLWFHVGYEF